MQDYSKLKVGDKVWYTDVNRKGMWETEVVKVGSKLITTTRLIFRKDTGRTNDEYGHQTLIVDKEAYEEEQNVKDALFKFREQINWRKPAGLTMAEINEAARILKININY